MLINNAHLTYCTNIHSGESWQEHFAALKEYFPAIKKAVSFDKPMGIGLRLSNIASLELSEKGNLDIFLSWLDSQSAYVFTMNGFPYGSFHHTRVKDQVHAPDWTTNERVDYTLRLFNILAELLPEGIEGGISTSPLSYRHWFDSSAAALEMVKKTATDNVLRVAEQLVLIKRETGRTLHLDIEPEPDGLIETGREFIEWFENELLKSGVQSFGERFSIDAAEAELRIREHIRLCYDVCHFAIGYESHADIVRELKEKGIGIGKIQISAALKAELNVNEEEKESIYNAFSGFDESTYLHQVVARQPDGSLTRYRDLPNALASASQESAEWRAHFHVPLFESDFGVLQSTSSDIAEVLNLHNAASLTSHLEVETYTWEVLPEALKLPLGDSIVREINWVKNQLRQA